MALTATQLRNHLDTDPDARGYAALITAGDHAALTDLMNAPNFGTVQDFRFTAEQLHAAIDPAELSALSAPQQTALQILFSVIASEGVLDASENSPGRNWILLIFGTTSVTVSALSTTAARPGTYAEVRAGVGTVVTIDDIREALAL